MHKKLVEKVPVNSVDLFITEQCNLDCRYCFHKKSNETLTWENGRSILRILHDINPDKMHITFFGGEPLLYPQLVHDLAVEARALWGKIVTMSISTNATFFDEKLFKKLKDLEITIQVSIDGDKETMEEARIGCNFDSIIENIIRMIEVGIPVSARMTYDASTVGKLASNVEFIYNLGINKIMHQAVIEDKWTDSAVKTYEYQLNQIYHFRRFVNRHSGKLKFLFIDKPLGTLNDETLMDKNYCEAGKTYLGILPNGDVYPCHRAASKRIFKLGNIFDDMPIIRGMFLQIDKNSTGCSRQCLASPTCHTCVITHYIVNGELGKPIQQYCEICAIEHNAAMRYIQTEINDRQESKINALSQVILDMAEQMNELTVKEKQC